MCRLAIFNKRGEKLLNEKMELSELFDDLEISQGGEGNGVAVIDKKGKVYIKKGIAFMNYEAVDFIHQFDYQWALFHTRLASAGSVNDKNCHPFKHGNIVLAMNGTEYEAITFADIFGMTDTEALLKIFVATKTNIAYLSLFSSVFVGFQGSRPFVISGGKSNDLVALVDNIKKPKGILFASELSATKFPTIYKPKSMPFFWTQGMDLSMCQKVANTNWVKSYYLPSKYRFKSTKTENKKSIDDGHYDYSDDYMGNEYYKEDRWWDLTKSKKPETKPADQTTSVTPFPTQKVSNN